MSEGTRSVAELVASLVPAGVEVVSAFQNVSAHRLGALERAVECDVIVSGAPAPRRTVMELVADIPGLRAIDGDPLYNARSVEALTALLIGVNVRYKPTAPACGSPTLEGTSLEGSAQVSRPAPASAAHSEAKPREVEMRAARLD